MTNHVEFENKILSMGYTFKDEYSGCTHLKAGNIIYYFYKHDCPCCNQPYNSKPIELRAKDLPWLKDELCENCLLGRLDSLGCGGHYYSNKIYKQANEGEIDVTAEYGMTEQPMDPNEIVYDLESEEDYLPYERVEF